MDEKEFKAKRQLAVLLKEYEKSFEKQQYHERGKKMHLYTEVSGPSYDEVNDRIRELARMEKRTVVAEKRERLSNNYLKRKSIMHPHIIRYSKAFNNGTGRRRRQQQQQQQQIREFKKVKSYASFSTDIQANGESAPPQPPNKTDHRGPKTMISKYKNGLKHDVKISTLETKRFITKDFVRELSLVEKKLLQIKIGEQRIFQDEIYENVPNNSCRMKRAQSARPRSRQHYSVSSHIERVSSANSKGHAKTRTFRRQSSFDVVESKLTSVSIHDKREMSQSIPTIETRDSKYVQSKITNCQLEKVSSPVTLKYYLKFVTNSPEKIPVKRKE